MLPRYTVRVACLVIAGLVAHPAQAQGGAPDGWSASAKRGIVTYTPGDLPTGEQYTVTLFPGLPTNSGTREMWLREKADADAIVVGGRIERRGEVSRSSPTIYTTSRVLRTAAGAQQLAVYFAVETSATQAHLIRVHASSAALLQRYQVATTTLVRSAGPPPTTSVETTAIAPVIASTSGAGPVGQPVSRGSAARTPVVNEDVSQIPSDLRIKSNVPKRNGYRAGGPIVIGTYVGQQISSDTREVVGNLTISLYANGEFRQTWKSRPDEPREDHFGYDPRTGRIDLDWGSLMDIENSRINEMVDFAVLGRMDDGTPVLAAENDRGFHTVMTVLVYTGPNTRPSPSAAKAALAAAEAEAARYKHVVPAGQGIQDAQIAAVYMHSQMHQSVGLSMQIGAYSTLSLYLLLTDGTIHDGIPVAPDEMDVGTSRRREPNTWGRWRRQGSDILVSWSVEPNRWQKLEGEQMVRSRPGEVLRGRFSGGESRASGDVGSYSLYGVEFGPQQRFETDSRGGTGTGSFTQVTGGTSIQTTRDDNGSVTTASTPGVIVSSESTRRRSSTAGSYRISGWNFEARYDDGRVVRQPFFFLDEKRDAIYWQEKVVSLDTGK
jgi:hypothetical protein